MISCKQCTVSTWRDTMYCMWQDLPDPFSLHQEARYLLIMILRSKVTNKSATEYSQRIHAIEKRNPIFCSVFLGKKGIGICFFPSEMGKGSASLAISLILYPEKGKKECVSLNLFMCFSFFFLSQIEMCQVNLLYVKRCYIPWLEIKDLCNLNIM